MVLPQAALSTWFCRNAATVGRRNAEVARIECPPGMERRTLAELARNGLRRGIDRGAREPRALQTRSRVRWKHRGQAVRRRAGDRVGTFRPCLLRSMGGT